MSNIVNGFMSEGIESENVMALSQEERKLWDEAIACSLEIESVFAEKGFGFLSSSAKTPVAAYLLAKVSEYKDPFSYKFEDLELLDIEKDVLEMAKGFSLDKAWDRIKELLYRYQPNAFYIAASLKKGDGAYVTPESLVLLAGDLLEIDAGDEIADLCCGTGFFADAVKRDYADSKVYGYDINSQEIGIAKISEAVVKRGIEYIQKDVFELGLEKKKKTFSKIFSNYPFGMRIKDLEIGKEYLDLLTKRIPAMSKATSSDWLFNSLVVDLLEEDGRAVCIMTNGSTWNQIDAPIRKYFVENGLIECVIALPERMFNATTIATSMVVFSHNNSGVRLVDATDCFTPGRRVNVLSDSNIDDILAATKEDTENSIFITKEKLRDNDYVLNQNRYIHVSEDIQDGRSFESVIKRVTRGAQINANDMDKLASSAPTDKQYLMLSNIKDGIIDTNLPYISEIDKKNEKYCISNRCIILSKNGYPYKVAVAEVKEGQHILANGNLYVIEVDENVVDPYYIAAFFGSEQGIAALKSITVGATIPNIGVEQLKKLVIPVPPLERQREIVEKYQSVKDEIVMLQIKIEKAKDRMAHILEEGGNFRCWM